MNYAELKVEDLLEIMIIGCTGKYVARVVKFDERGAPVLSILKPENSIFTGKPYLRDGDFIILDRASL